jgi:hypothetical protein
MPGMPDRAKSWRNLVEAVLLPQELIALFDDLASGYDWRTDETDL